MKDNKQNLSNELSDAAAESVAGGRWTSEDLSILGGFAGFVQEAALGFDSPEQFISHLLNLYDRGREEYKGMRVKARPIYHLIKEFNLTDGGRMGAFAEWYESKNKGY